MAKNILLKISTPTKKIVEKSVAKVSIPAFNGDLTILLDRAPCEILLKSGEIKILSEDAKVLEIYKTAEGIADVAGDTCSVFVLSAEKVSPN